MKQGTICTAACNYTSLLLDITFRLKIFYCAVPHSNVRPLNDLYICIIDPVLIMFVPDDIH